MEESLRKLQTDYLDLVLIHQCLSDYYGAYRALEDLYDEGKIRAIGISNFSAERMADIATFIVIGNPSVNSPPDFPPLQTVHESFPSHGFPSFTNCHSNQQQDLYAAQT